MYFGDYPPEGAITVELLKKLLDQLSPDQLLKINSKGGLNVYSPMASEINTRPIKEVDFGEEIIKPIPKL